MVRKNNYYESHAIKCNCVTKLYIQHILTG